MWKCITDFNKDIDLFTVCATAAIRLATVHTQEERNTVNVKSNTLCLRVRVLCLCWVIDITSVCRIFPGLSVSTLACLRRCKSGRPAARLDSINFNDRQAAGLFARCI